MLLAFPTRFGGWTFSWRPAARRGGLRAKPTTMVAAGQRRLNFCSLAPPPQWLLTSSFRKTCAFHISTSKPARKGPNNHWGTWGSICEGIKGSRLPCRRAPLRANKSPTQFGGFPGWPCHTRGHFCLKGPTDSCTGICDFASRNRFMPGVGESLGPNGKRGAFARISAEILELAEGAAKDLRLLPVGGTGIRGVGEYKQPSLFDWTVTGQILSRDSHRRVCTSARCTGPNLDSYIECGGRGPHGIF